MLCEPLGVGTGALVTRQVLSITASYRAISCVFFQMLKEVTGLETASRVLHLILGSHQRQQDPSTNRRQGTRAGQEGGTSRFDPLRGPSRTQSGKI